MHRFLFIYVYFIQSLCSHLSIYSFFFSIPKPFAICWAVKNDKSKVGHPRLIFIHEFLKLRFFLIPLSDSLAAYCIRWMLMLTHFCCHLSVVPCLTERCRKKFSPKTYFLRRIPVSVSCLPFYFLPITLFPPFFGDSKELHLL